MKIQLTLPQDLIQIGNEARVAFLTRYNGTEVAVSFDGVVEAIRLVVDDVSHDVCYYYKIREKMNNDTVWVMDSEIRAI